MVKLTVDCFGLVFLIHRVELKVHSHKPYTHTCFSVSNSPCGVERRLKIISGVFQRKFLIHRVELKVHLEDSESQKYLGF